MGGLRVLGVNAGGAKHGVFTGASWGADQRGSLCQPARHGHRAAVEGRRCARGPTARRAPRWTATRVDLVFGSNVLCAFAEVYACADSPAKFSTTSSPPGRRS
ncbi:MAG: hypothetical protein U1F87_08500 [Kiritimatiellia bacterium]